MKPTYNCGFSTTLFSLGASSASRALPEESTSTLISKSCTLVLLHNNHHLDRTVVQIKNLRSTTADPISDEKIYSVIILSLFNIYYIFIKEFANLFYFSIKGHVVRVPGIEGFVVLVWVPGIFFSIYCNLVIITVLWLCYKICPALWATIVPRVG